MKGVRCEPGYRLAPEVGAFTANERAWIGFLRLLSDGCDPAPSLQAVQALRQVLQRSDADAQGDRAAGIVGRLPD